MTKPVSVPNSFATATGNVPASQLDTNFGNLGTAVNDIGTYANNGTDSGVANAYVISFPAGITFSLASGIEISFQALNSSTSTVVTANVGGTGALPVVRQDGSLPASGDINSQVLTYITYNAAAGKWFLRTSPLSWVRAQTQTNFASSGRSFGQNYTNSTNNTMFVEVSITASTNTPTAISAIVNGVTIEGPVVAVSGYTSMMTVAVPPGGAYQMNILGGAGSLTGWLEVS